MLSEEPSTDTGSAPFFINAFFVSHFLDTHHAAGDLANLHTCPSDIHRSRNRTGLRPQGVFRCLELSLLDNCNVDS